MESKAKRNSCNQVQIEIRDIVHQKNQELRTETTENQSIAQRFQRIVGNIYRRNICKICENTSVSPTKTVFIADCKHKRQFCESCLHHYAIYTIQQRFGKVFCPSSGCKKEMDAEGAFLKSLPASIQEKYRKIYRFYATLEDPNIKLCPKDGCEGMVRIPKDAQPMKCEACSSSYCPKCLLQMHQGSCETFELEFFTKSLHYRQCPRCKIVIDRFQGCNHMTCTCSHQFCYVCGAEWTSDHYGNRNHDENGNFVPSKNTIVESKNEERSTQVDSMCYLIKLTPRIMISLILFSLLAIPLTVVAIYTVLRMIFAISCGQNVKDSPGIWTCLDPICQLYLKVVTTFLNP